MGLIDELLGCPLYDITRPYWAVKLNTGEWLCEARYKTDIVHGTERLFDWSNDLVANEDVLKITELWLLCPPSPRSPFGNTAMLTIEEPGTAFQFKVGSVESVIATSIKTFQAQIIGKITNKETGVCDVFIWDNIQRGLITPTTCIYDKQTHDAKRDAFGQVISAGKTTVYDFHSWRDGIAPLGRLDMRTLGIRI